MKSQTEAGTPSQQSACSALTVISEGAKAAQGFPAHTSSAHMADVTGTALLEPALLICRREPVVVGVQRGN